MMLFQTLPTTPNDWLQYGALGILALVLTGVGYGAFQILKAYIAHIMELGKVLAEMSKSLFELCKGIAILNEQTEDLHTILMKNQEMIAAVTFVADKGFNNAEIDRQWTAQRRMQTPVRSGQERGEAK